jgi:1-pyrroline-5-carboxylate dehydrogenase
MGRTAARTTQLPDARGYGERCRACHVTLLEIRPTTGYNARWAAFSPVAPLSAPAPHPNFAVAGAWTKSAQAEVVVDPMNGEPFLQVPDTGLAELAPFVDSLAACPKTGLHNPLRDVDRYRMLGDVSFKAAAALRDPAVFDFFAKLVQRTSPKSDAQAAAEVRITRQFLDNFTGDNVRFLARGFSVPGDHNGQESHGYRFPFGPVSIITPFNFPIEIPALQVRRGRREGGGSDTGWGG